MINPRGTPIIQHKEEITLQVLNEADKFIRMMSQMMTIQLRVLAQFANECHSPLLFAIMKDIYLHTTEIQKTLGEASGKVNDMLFRLLDFGANPERNMGGEG